MTDQFRLLKSKDYSRLIPKHGIDHNGKPFTVWIDPYKDRDEDPELEGQQAMFDMDSLDQAHHGKPRGWHDKVRADYDEHVVKPLISRMSEIDPAISKRLEWKYGNYVFDQETKEIDLEVDLETAKYLKLRKDTPEYAEDHRKEYDEATAALKKMVNNRKRHMASKMLDLKKGAELPLTNGRAGVFVGYNDRGYPMVKVGAEPQPIFWEEVRYAR